MTKPLRDHQHNATWIITCSNILHALSLAPLRWKKGPIGVWASHGDLCWVPLQRLCVCWIAGWEKTRLALEYCNPNTKDISNCFDLYLVAWLVSGRRTGDRDGCKSACKGASATVSRLKQLKLCALCESLQSDVWKPSADMRLTLNPELVYS